MWGGEGESFWRRILSKFFVNNNNNNFILNCFRLMVQPFIIKMLMNSSAKTDIEKLPRHNREETMILQSQKFILAD